MKESELDMFRFRPVIQEAATLSEVDAMSVPDLYDLNEALDIKQALTPDPPKAD